MRNAKIVLVIFCAFSFFYNVKAQDNHKSIKYHNDFKFKDGIYFSFTNVIKSEPIIKGRIVGLSSGNKSFAEILEAKEISIIDDFGMKSVIKTSSIWGYADMGALYVQVSNDFHRITMIGTISHVFVSQTVYSTRYMDPYYYNYGYPMYSPTYQTKQMVQYLIDFRTGQIFQMNLGTVEALLSQDSELYSEFSQLRKRKKRQLMLYYIRKFNDRNPLYITYND